MEVGRFGVLSVFVLQYVAAGTVVFLVLCWLSSFFTAKGGYAFLYHSEEYVVVFYAVFIRSSKSNSTPLFSFDLSISFFNPCNRFRFLLELVAIVSGF